MERKGRVIKFSLIMLLMMGLFLSKMTIQVYATEAVTDEKEEISNARQYFGKTVYAGNGEGYTKREKVEEDNPHYGWELGDMKPEVEDGLQAITRRV